MNRLIFTVVIFMLVSSSAFCQSKKTWQKKQDSNSIAAYQEFLTKYPDGKYSEIARQRMADLEKFEAEQARKIEIRKNECMAAGEKIVPGLRCEKVISLLAMNDVVNRSAFGGIYVGNGVLPENENEQSTFTGLASLDGYDIIFDQGKVVSKKLVPEQIGSGRVNFSSSVDPSGTISEKDRLKNAADEKSKAAMIIETRKNQESMLIANYLIEKNITAAPLESGLIYLETLAGQGVRATAGKNVVVHYSATLLDGTKFDSSYDRNEPIAFTLGVGQVIKGWDEGIALMNVGGKATLIIPSALAYGERDMGIIPPFSTLVFDVELIDVQ